MWDVFKLVGSTHGDPDVAALSLLVLQVVFVLILFVAPLVWSLALLVAWTARLGARGRARALAIAEAAYCWSALDVFVVTLLLAIPSCPLLARSAATHARAHAAASTRAPAWAALTRTSSILAAAG